MNFNSQMTSNNKHVTKEIEFKKNTEETHQIQSHFKTKIYLKIYRGRRNATKKENLERKTYFQQKPHTK